MTEVAKGKNITSEIPYYKGSGPLGLAKAFIANNAKFVHEKEEELGDFYRIKLLTFPLFATFRPSVIRHVLQTNARNYKKSPAYGQLKLGLGNGLVTSEGDVWKRQRKMAQPAFYKARLAALFETMTTVVDEYVAQLKPQIGIEKEVDVAQLMTEITADIVLQTLFSAKNSILQESLFHRMDSIQAYIMHRVYHPFRIPLQYINGRHRRFKKDLTAFGGQVFDLIEARRNSKNRPSDLLTMLLEAKDAETGEQMSDTQLRDEAITIFSAGHETSSNAMAWTLYLLAQHPEVLHRLRLEEKNVLNGKVPTFGDLQQLRLHRQVIEEGMRLYPPAHVVGRQAIAKDEIEGVAIPPKSIMYLSIFALHRSPKYWDDPLVFNPDRFAPEKRNQHPKLTYMPFGAGARMCIGNQFALMEMQLILARWIRHFDFENVSDEPLDYLPLITLKPKNGVKQRLRVVG